MQDTKKKAMFCHVSQNPAGIYEADDCNHGLMEKFRGMEIGVPAAEGFVKCGSLNINRQDMRTAKKYYFNAFTSSNFLS